MSGRSERTAVNVCQWENHSRDPAHVLSWLPKHLSVKFEFECASVRALLMWDPCRHQSLSYSFTAVMSEELDEIIHGTGKVQIREVARRDLTRISKLDAWY